MTSPPLLRFAVVRPYDERFRARVFALLESLGFGIEDVPRLPSGSGDEEVGRWLRTLTPPPDLLLIPFHQHRTESGAVVDGLSALSVLGDVPALRSTPIFMPVSDYAFASSFPRRFDAFRSAHPTLSRRVLAVAAADIVHPTTLQTLRTALDVDG